MIYYTVTVKRGDGIMNYRINLGEWRSVFAVPARVSECLKTASGNQLKVILYLLKNSDIPYSAEVISRDTGVPVSEIDDAMLFWENIGILDGGSGEYRPSETAAAASVHAAVPAALPAMTISEQAAEIRAAAKSEIQFPPKEIASAVNASEDVKYLFDTYQRLSGKLTTHAERNVLMQIIDVIKLPCEVAIMMIEYCFSIDKATPAYMRTVAADWWENGIDTVKKAEDRIKYLNNIHRYENALYKKFGMTSAFSKKQKDFISAWAELGISEELIDEAYNITIDNTGKLSFPYMDKILRKWNADGVNSPDEITKKTAEPSQTVISSSIDMNEMEQWTINKYSRLHKKGEESE